MKVMKLAAALVLGLGVPAWSASNVTKDEATAMVKKAVDYLKQNGPEKAYAAFEDKTGQFVDRDLYIIVFSKNGRVLAHGANVKMVGKDMNEAQDVDGKYYVKERLALAAKGADFWQDYKFVNPVSRKIEPKQMYCQPLTDTIVCGGVYKN